MKLYDILRASKVRIVPAAMLVPAVAAIYIATGGCKQSPQQAEQPETAISRPLDKAVGKAPEALTDQKLLELYQQALPKARQYQEEEAKALEAFAQRSGIKVDEIRLDDYELVTRSFREKMRTDPQITTILTLEEHEQSKLVDLVNKNMDASKVRRSKVNYFAKWSIPIYRDPELSMPATVTHLQHEILLVVSSPLIYAVDQEKQLYAIQIGRNLWANVRDYDTKMTDYARELFQQDLVNLTKAYSALSTFLRKIKPGDSIQRIDSMLSEESEETRTAIENALGIAPKEKKFKVYAVYLLAPTEKSAEAMGKRLDNLNSGIQSVRAYLGQRNN